MDMNIGFPHKDIKHTLGIFEYMQQRKIFDLGGNLLEDVRENCMTRISITSSLH
jgi:hypothetical protein